MIKKKYYPFGLHSNGITAPPTQKNGTNIMCYLWTNPKIKNYNNFFCLIAVLTLPAPFCMWFSKGTDLFLTVPYNGRRKGFNLAKITLKSLSMKFIPHSGI